MHDRRWHIEANIADNRLRKGCVRTNSVRMSKAGGVHAGFDKITCEAAAALVCGVRYLGRQRWGGVAAVLSSFGVELVVSMFFSPLTMDGPLGAPVSPDPDALAAATIDLN